MSTVQYTNNRLLYCTSNLKTHLFQPLKTIFKSPAVICACAVGLCIQDAQGNRNIALPFRPRSYSIQIFLFAGGRCL